METRTNSREQAIHRLQQVLEHYRARLSPALSATAAAILHPKLPIKGMVRQEEHSLV